MGYSFTGFAYLIFFFALGYLAHRFFQYWKKERDLVSKLWLYIITLVEVFALIKAIGGLFFSTNSRFLEMTMDIAAAIQAFIFAILAYLIVYIKFPKISPWFGFILILILGLIALTLTIMSSFDPYLELSGAINWGFPSGPFVFTMSMLRLFLALVTLIPIIIIFFQQFMLSKDPYIRKKTLGMSLAFLIILPAGVFDFLFVNIFKLDPIWRDLSFIIFSIILFITLLLTRKLPQ